MSGIKSFLTAFCVGCVMLGALFVLVPDGALKKQIKYAFCLAFTVTVISVCGIVNISDFNFTVKSDNGYNYEKLLCTAAQSAIKTALTNENISFDEITVYTDNSEDGGIFISKVIIKSSADKSRIEKIFENCDYTVEVLNE